MAGAAIGAVRQASALAAAGHFRHLPLARGQT
jgi:hypothetical protein